MNRITRLLSVAGLTLVGGAAGALLTARSREVRAAERLRASLERSTHASMDHFRPEMVADLPAPARRYFERAISPGTPLAYAARLEMAGHMRLGREKPWLPFQARQVLAPPFGFVWEARAGIGPMHIAGVDAYANGRGLMAFRLWDLIPVARASGPDVSRSARGRLAIESVWQPASLLPQHGVRWTAIDDQTVQATLTIDGEVIPLTLTISPDGSLQSVAMERWGDPAGEGRHALVPFGADVLAERRLDGYTVPSSLWVSWWYGTGRAFEFFQGTLMEGAYLTSSNGTAHA